MWNVIPENLMYMDRVKRRNCDIGLLPRLCGKQTADVILCGGEMLHGRRMLYGGKILHDGKQLFYAGKIPLCAKILIQSLTECIVT